MGIALQQCRAALCSQPTIGTAGQAAPAKAPLLSPVGPAAGKFRPNKQPVGRPRQPDAGRQRLFAMRNSSGMLEPVHEYSLQPARIADARRLAVMSHELVEAGLRPAWSASRITWHMRHPESIVLTARHDGATVAFAIMRYGDDVAHLNLLAVDPAHRRRGVARKVMTWLEETALTAGTFII